jgi:beta-mannosidase
LWSESGVAAGSRVHARLRSADGDVLARACWQVEDAVGDPQPVGTLTVDARGLPTDAVVAWDMRWVSADGATVDREVVLACTGGDFAPLLDLGPATLAVGVRASDETTFVVDVAHRGGPLVVGLRLLDDRAPEPTGWTVISGDPRPLLPGERRAFTVRGSHSSARPRVLLESWNTDPIRLDLANLDDLDLTKEPLP